MKFRPDSIRSMVLDILGFSFAEKAVLFICLGGPVLDSKGPEIHSWMGLFV